MRYDTGRTYPKELGKGKDCAQDQMFKYLNALPYTSVDKKHQGTYASQAGFSDFVGVHKGYAVYIEVKAENGKPTAKQREFIIKKLMCGARAGFARSIADCLDILNGGKGADI